MPEIDNKSTTGNDPRLKEVEESLEKRDITFEALFRFFEKIGTTFDLDVIIKLLLMTIVGQLGLRRVSFFLRRERANRIDLYHSIGMRRQAGFPAFSLESSFVRWMNEKDGVVSIDDYFEPEGKEYGEDRAIGEALIANGLSYVCDLKEGDKLIGIMAFSNKVSGEGFSEFDKDLLIMMAKVAAITIRNAALYQSVLKSRNELENFSRMKKEFIDHTSHELRTPITVLRSSLWSIETAGDEAELMGMARESVLRLEEKVENILSLNEMDINGAFIEPLVVEISGLIISACREMADVFEEKEILLDVSNSLGERYISIDPSRIKTVIRSLLENAVAAIECKGSIQIMLSEHAGAPGEEGETEISAWDSEEKDSGTGAFKSAPNSWLVIRIIDDGRGIPEGEILTVGNPFVRASNSAVGDIKGLGVGLSFAQKIVTGHDGHIFCRSVENEGTEFSIWLPDQ